MNLTEIKHQARAIWLTISQKFNSDIDQKENCTFTFEIHTRNVEYDKILERQSTEVVFIMTRMVFFLLNLIEFIWNRKYILRNFSGLRPENL